MLTSLIATCLHAGVNALEYLVALQEHRAEVFADPAGVVALDLSGQSGAALGDATPIVGHVGALRIAIPQHNEELTSGQGHACVCRLGHHVKRPCESLFIQSQ